MAEYASGWITPRCDWQTGTAFTGPRTCGRPAKWTVDENGQRARIVCGIHKRSALALATRPVVVTSLADEPEATDG